ncbi:MAG: glycosyltransferase, partial [Verrucomicrobiae bacterium]|nr:glycosyltransferase [Verrucomicrobiae bacterium]
PNRADRRPESCPVKDWEATDPVEGIQRMMDQIMVGPALKYARDLLAELDREPADLVITSEMLPGVMAACESRGQRMAIFAANLCFYPLPGMPAFGPGFSPPRNTEEAALHEQVKAGTIQMLDTGLDSFNRTRMQLGLVPLQHVSDQINTAKLFLLGTSQTFDFPAESIPEKIRYVGPQLDEPAWTKAWTSPWPNEDTRPLIAVGFSTTFQNHSQVLQNVLDAAESLPIRLLVTLGPIEASELRPTANAVLVQSAPHDAVMRQAKVVVTHGGHGTVMRALKHQCPMLILPHGRDQGENAIRITERGAGLCLTADASCEQIEEALRQLIEEPSFSEAAARMGKAIQAEIDQSPVVPILEGLVSCEKEQTCLAG